MAKDNTTKDETSNDVVVPAGAQTAPSDVDTNTGNQPKGETKSEAKTVAAGDPHVTQHLDRDPNDPRNAAPTPQLPSLDEDSMQGPEHGRVSNEDDQSAEGQNGPNV